MLRQPYMCTTCICRSCQASFWFRKQTSWRRVRRLKRQRRRSGALKHTLGCQTQRNKTWGRTQNTLLCGSKLDAISSHRTRTETVRVGLRAGCSQPRRRFVTGSTGACARPRSWPKPATSCSARGPQASSTGLLAARNLRARRAVTWGESERTARRAVRCRDRCKNRLQVRTRHRCGGPAVMPKDWVALKSGRKLCCRDQE
mmetsp:Transcript_17236/g.41757  ORF Transcript_17236/g.41757 Transcript_17236/m.41757 type:complete len:201 (+) Transcript_17236:418-1020(+)